MVQRVVLEQLIGYYGGGYDVMKRNIYDNYYKTSGKAYGGANFTWKPWRAKATRVSSVTAGAVGSFPTGTGHIPQGMVE